MAATDGPERRENTGVTTPIIMHVNYCEQGQDLSDICRKAVAWGFDGVEFRQRRFTVEEKTEDYLSALECAVRESGLKQVIFGYPCLDMNLRDAKARQEQASNAIGFYRHVAERFPVTVVNAFASLVQNLDPKVPGHDYGKQGSFIATEEQWKWAVEGFQALADGCRDTHLKFAFETHMLYLHDTVAATLKLVERIDRPNVGVNLDYGNIVYFPGHPAIKETISQIGKRLYYVHLKNSIQLFDGERIPTALSEGAINHREYISTLLESGFDGPVCVEAPRSGDREWYAQQDITYIKSVIADCKKVRPAQRRADSQPTR